MTIISIPLVISCFFVNIISPFITIVGTYCFAFLFAFGVPTVILASLSLIGWLVLKPETIVFIVFAIGSILCSSSYRTTKWMIHHTPLRDWGNHTYEAYREALAIYLIHPSNVIFLLYLIYFAFFSGIWISTDRKRKLFDISGIRHCCAKSLFSIYRLH